MALLGVAADAWHLALQEAVQKPRPGSQGPGEQGMCRAPSETKAVRIGCMEDSSEPLQFKLEGVKEAVL